MVSSVFGSFPGELRAVKFKGEKGDTSIYRIDGEKMCTLYF